MEEGTQEIVCYTAKFEFGKRKRETNLRTYELTNDRKEDERKEKRKKEKEINK